jgi:hypothetical protein
VRAVSSGGWVPATLPEFKIFAPAVEEDHICWLDAFSDKKINDAIDWYKHGCNCVNDRRILDSSHNSEDWTHELNQENDQENQPMPH